MTHCLRVDDDVALRAKVDEALTVYDEYVRTKTGGEEGTEDKGGPVMNPNNKNDTTKKPESGDDSDPSTTAPPPTKNEEVGGQENPAATKTGAAASSSTSTPVGANSNGQGGA